MTTLNKTIEQLIRENEIRKLKAQKQKIQQETMDRVISASLKMLAHTINQPLYMLMAEIEMKDKYENG